MFDIGMGQNEKHEEPAPVGKGRGGARHISACSPPLNNWLNAQSAASSVSYLVYSSAYLPNPGMQTDR